VIERGREPSRAEQSMRVADADGRRTEQSRKPGSLRVEKKLSTEQQIKRAQTKRRDTDTACPVVQRQRVLRRD